MARRILALIVTTLTLVDYARNAEAQIVGDVAVEQLVAKLNSDPEQIAGENRQEWYMRISLKNLDVADKILAHPDATSKHKEEASDRKLAALDVLAGRDPKHYKERWTEFANRVIDEHPGSPLARKADHSILERMIGHDPTDPKIVSGINRFTKTYSGSDGQICQLYVRLTALLYERDPKQAIEILDRAITSLPPDLSTTLRQHRNTLTMIGVKLTMSWRKLNGKPFVMTELRGKVVLVYSWATWCVPCIEKFPMLNDLYAKYHAEGFEIVAVSQNEDRLDVVKFLEKRELPWIHVMHSEEYREKYGNMGTPGSLLINRDGIVVDRAIFAREEIESAIKRSLKVSAEGGHK